MEFQIYILREVNKVRHNTALLRVGVDWLTAAAAAAAAATDRK